MSKAKNIKENRSHMNDDILMDGSQLLATDHGVMTVAEGLLKYWAAISAGWNEQTKLLYLALYLQIIAPIGNLPVTQVDLYKHIYPLAVLYFQPQSDAATLRTCPLSPNLQAYLLRRFFWTLAASEGFQNPFDMVIA